MRLKQELRRQCRLQSRPSLKWPADRPGYLLRYPGQ
jgi:hypothetical protein